MRITKLFGALALGGILAAGVAYAAATSSTPALPAPQADEPTTAATPVTATWAMGTTTNTGITATSVPEDALKTSTQSFSGITYKQVRKATMSDGSSLNFTTYSAMQSVTVDKSGYVEFSAEPNGTLAVNKIAVTWCCAKHQSGKMDVELIVDGKATTIATALTPPKYNGNTNDATTEFSKNFSVSASASESIKLRFYLYGDASNAREMGFANVVLSGTLYEEGTEIPETAPAGWAAIPGVLNKIELATNATEAGWTIGGAIKYDSQDGQFGSIKNGGWCSTNFFCDKAGAYNLVVPFKWDQSSGQNDDIRIEITDQTTGKKEIDQHYAFTGGRTEQTIPLEGVMTRGCKTIKFTFTSPGTGYITNIMAPTFNWVSESDDSNKTPAGYLEMPGTLTISKTYWSENGLLIEKAETDTPNFGYASNGNSATAKVFCKEAGVYSANIDFYAFYSVGDVTLEVTDEATGNVEAKTVHHLTAGGKTDIVLGGKITTGKKALKISFSNVGGSFCANFYAPVVTKVEVGEGAVTEVTVDGVAADAAVLEALNGNGQAAVADRVYTAVPAVKAVFDGSMSVDATVTVEGGKAVATFAHPMIAGKVFTLDIEGLHIYAAAENDKAVKLVYDSNLKQADGSWSNGLYTIRNTDDGWGGTQFKFKPGTHTLEVPANVVVKQLVFAKLGDNYGNGKITNVTSEGAADIWLPTKSEFLCTNADKGGNPANFYNLVVNIEGHQAGTPISFTFEGGSQPVAWFELLVEEQRLQGEPTVQNGSNTQVDTKNHCVVTLDFGRKMQECVAEYNGKAVKADGGTTALKFSLWDLAWGDETVLTIPAGAAKDIDGNTNSEAITYTVAVAQRPTTVDPVEKYAYVSTVEELRAAVADANATNKTADAPRYVIFIKNGTYDLGSDVFYGPNDKGEDAWQSPANSDVCLHINRAYNVSLIGESRDGVVIKGERTGISNPIFSTRYSSNIYMENFTLLNYLDYGKERKGVAVAHYGGNRDIMVNILMQSQQDTQVTGEQGYYYNCEIHGTVDYVCGGGTHFYDQCVFVQQAAGAITAPSTSEALKYGYVFQNCEIKGAAGYTLGRPWQNNPSCHWLNTTMESLPAEKGWAGMGDLYTRFFEYNSMDAAGNAVDTSKRASANDKKPQDKLFLTDEEAAEFTVENVLGGDDSWLATEELALGLEAPEGVEYVKSDKGDHAEYIHWLPVSGAAGYLLFNNGEFVGYAPGNHDSFDLLTNSSYIQPETQSRAGETFSYTIRAISPNGTMSAHSMAMTPQNPTGIEAVGADAVVKVEYYNLQGQPVSEGYRGAAIKVETSADGTRVASKVLAD